MIFSPIPGRLFRITQRFGKNPGVYKQFGMIGHNGLDLAPFIPGTKGVVIHAPHEGYVTLGDEGKHGYGKYVSIVGLPYNHEGTCRRSDLAHMASFLVKNGQFVSAGDPIGIMGSTGFSDGIHTHWTYKRMKDGKVLDYDNGYKGAIDVSQWAIYWSGSHL